MGGWHRTDDADDDVYCCSRVKCSAEVDMQLTNFP